MGAPSRTKLYTYIHIIHKNICNVGSTWYALLSQSYFFEIGLLWKNVPFIKIHEKHYIFKIGEQSLQVIIPSSYTVVLLPSYSILFSSHGLFERCELMQFQQNVFVSTKYWWNRHKSLHIISFLFSQLKKLNANLH